MYKGMVFGAIVVVVSLLSGCTTPAKALSVKKLPKQIIETDNLDTWPEVPSIDALNVTKAFPDFSMRYRQHTEKVERLSDSKRCSPKLPELVSAGLLDKNSARMYEIIGPSSIDVFSMKGCDLDENVANPILLVLSFPSSGKSTLSKVIYYREQLSEPINNFSVVEVKEVINSAENVSMNSRTFSVSYSLSPKSESFIAMTRAELWDRSINEIKHGEVVDGVPYIYSHSRYKASRQINGKLNGILWSKNQGKTTYFCYLPDRSSPYWGYVLRDGEWGCTPVDKSEAGKAGVVKAS